MKKMGNLQNFKNIEVYQIGKYAYALNGWNGEQYNDCWRVNNKTFQPVEKYKKITYIIKPIEELEELDREGSYQVKLIDFEIIDYFEKRR